MKWNRTKTGLALLTFLVVMALGLVCAGCATGDPWVAYRNAEDLYATALETATQLGEAGYLDEQEARAILDAERIARAALDEWRRGLKQGGSTLDAWCRAMAAINRMVLILDSETPEERGVHR